MRPTFHQSCFYVSTPIKRALLHDAPTGWKNLDFLAVARESSGSEAILIGWSFTKKGLIWQRKVPQPSPVKRAADGIRAMSRRSAYHLNARAAWCSLSIVMHPRIRDKMNMS